MNKVFLYFSFIFLSINGYASYEVDFLVGETKNTRPLSYALKIKEIDLKDERFLNPQGVRVTDEDDEPIEYRDPQNGDVIQPRQFLHFKISSDCSQILPENRSLFPSTIVFDILNEEEESLDSAVLSWYYGNGKINFIDSGESTFFFLPFQRQISTIDKKGIYRNKYEISLINSKAI